jgi:hypothetical protein
MKTGFRYDSRSGLSPINILTFTEQRTLPSLVLAFSTASYRVELIPYVAMRFISVSVEAATPLRLQADFNYVAPDAVLCDIPRCTVGSTGVLPVYATYQMRLQINLKELRFKHLTSIMPWLFNSVIDALVSDFVVFPEQHLMDAPATARFKLLSLCAPGYVSLVGGGGCLLARTTAPSCSSALWASQPRCPSSSLRHPCPLQQDCSQRPIKIQT